MSRRAPVGFVEVVVLDDDVLAADVATDLPGFLRVAGVVVRILSA